MIKSKTNQVLFEMLERKLCGCGKMQMVSKQADDLWSKRDILAVLMCECDAHVGHNVYYRK